MARTRALLDRRCVIPKGASFGDRRFRYKAFWCLSPDEKAAVRGRYPHSAPGIPDSAYAYPIDSRGRIARARRTPLWSRAHTVRRVGKHRAAALTGARRRRRR